MDLNIYLYKDFEMKKFVNGCFYFFFWYKLNCFFGKSKSFKNIMYIYILYDFVFKELNTLLF